VIYVDSCLVIYAVERDDSVGNRARDALAGTDQPLATSPLVMLEALVGPMRERDALSQSDMWSALDRFELLRIHDDDYLDAARLRARHRGLRTADALHLAVARRAGCTAFWTNDARLTAASGGMAVDVIGAG